MGVELRVLGPLEVAGEDGLVALPGGKHRRLLAALSLADGRACTADAIADAVWGDSPPASARKLLQLYVSQLRKTLPAGIDIVTRPTGYALDLSRGLLDAKRFDGLAREASEALAASNSELAVSLAERALALWRGPAYADVMYDDFARGEAERLEELRVVVTEERLDAQLRLGRGEAALPEALALADAYPLRERAEELAMVALYRAGRQTEALDRYAALRRRLDEELGLEPGRTLRDLQRRILQQDASLESPIDATDSPGARAIRVAPNPLVGRERELALLDELLSRREARLVVLTGAGGSGKTRLGLEVARRAAPTFANGAVAVELAALRDPDLVPRAIADAFGLAEASDGDQLDMLVDALAEHEVLLVVDNAEHLREAAPLYVQLVERLPRLTILVTSRAVLHVSGEHVVPVAPLDLEDAVELFDQRARALDPTFELDDANAADARDICRRVDGLPLAIELAAGRIRTLTTKALLERLDARLEVLTRGPRDMPARQRTLRETIDWSVELFDPRERTVFAGLAVFPAGATLHAAETVCGADLDSLQGLVDGNLVRRLEGVDESRFGMLETIREYALELLGPDRLDAERAMASFLADLVGRAELRGPRQAEWLVRLDGELDNLRTALDVAAGADSGLELRLAGGLWRYWWVRGLLGEGLARIEAALARDTGGPSVARAHALQGAAGLAYARGGYERAKALAHDAIATAASTGATWEEMAANTVLGVVATNEADYASARHHLERSLELADGLGLADAVITAKLNLGNVAVQAGELASAGALFSDVLDAHRAADSAEGIGFGALNLGHVQYRLGRHASARSSFEEAREAFARISFRAHVAHALQGLAAVEAAEGRQGESARLLGRAAAELDEVGWSDDDFDATLAGEVEASARTALGEDVFARAYAAGRAGE